MKFDKVVLPSNKKFGLFFAFVFFVFGAYSYVQISANIGLVWFLVSFSFLALSIVKPSLLSSLNKIWMRLGFLLGMIVSPIVLGIFFFLIFVPIGFAFRVFGRDELALKMYKRDTFWVSMSPEKTNEINFHNQF